jgi:hypothetical protein
MKRRDSFVVLLVGVMFLVSCAYNIGMVNSTYKLLTVSNVSYDTAMKTAADLYAQKRITIEQKNEIIKIGKTFAGAHNAAVEALACYEETKDVSEQEKMSAQIVIASEALTNLLALIKPYLLEVK